METSIEVQILVWSVILGILEIMAAAHLATMQRGIKWNMGMRESNMAPLTGMAGRAERAYKNFLETFPFFIAAVFAVHAFGKTGSNLSVLGAEMYLGFRLLHFLFYAAGIQVLRTLAWGGSMIGIGLLIWVALT